MWHTTSLQMEINLYCLLITALGCIEINAMCPVLIARWAYISICTDIPRLAPIWLWANQISEQSDLRTQQQEAKQVKYPFSLLTARKNNFKFYFMGSNLLPVKRVRENWKWQRCTSINESEWKSANTGEITGVLFIFPVLNGCNQSTIPTGLLCNTSFPSSSSHKCNDKASLDDVTLFVFTEANLHVEVQVSLKQ